MIKFFAARVLHDVIDRAIQVHGALGYSKDTPLEMFYRDARAARIYDGPDEVHRQAVAQRSTENVVKPRGHNARMSTSNVQSPLRQTDVGPWTVGLWTT